MIEPLAEPQDHDGDATDAFHVIAPSLPGFGFSGKPTETGCGVEKIADVWATLTERLGHERVVAQGGDWGSAITAALGRRHPDHCTAVHMTLAMGARSKAEPTTPEEHHAVERMRYYTDWDSGYSTQQKSRPQTVGYGLTDSPAGQAAWILEKFWAWTDNDGRPEDAGARDDLLDNVMIYWVTETAASSARIYWESYGRGGSRDPVNVPAGFGVYPAEIVQPVRAWLDDKFPNIVHWAEFDRGGHFAAFEVPETFVADIRAFARAVL